MIDKIQEYYPIIIAIMHSLDITKLEIKSEDFEMDYNENLSITTNVKNQNYEFKITRR